MRDQSDTTRLKPLNARQMQDTREELARLVRAGCTPLEAARKVHACLTEEGYRLPDD
jgi:hypothetical protein